MASKFNLRNVNCSCLTASGGRGSAGGWQRMGITAAMDVKRGMIALRRRYNLVDEGFSDFAARLYNAALTPLKLTVRARASGRVQGKFFMQSTKHTVLNQQMLHPANKHNKNTCNRKVSNIKLQMEYSETP